MASKLGDFAVAAEFLGLSPSNFQIKWNAENEAVDRPEAKEKLNQLSADQVSNLSKDITAEIKRRTNQQPTDSLDEAGKRLNSLPLEKFRDLVADLFWELNRRDSSLSEKYVAGSCSLPETQVLAAEMMQELERTFPTVPSVAENKSYTDDQCFPGSVVDAVERSQSFEQHKFSVFNYTSPTYCDHCHKFLWGVARQGVRCVTCGFDAHQSCQDKVAVPCRPGNYHIRSRSVKRKASISSVISCTSSLRSAEIPSELLSSIDRRKNIVKKTRSFLEEFTVQSMMAAATMERNKKELNPSLDLTITVPKNTINFVARISGLVDTVDFLEDLFTWRDPVLTGWVMCACVFFCFNPRLLVLIPFGIALFMASSTYIEKQQYENTLSSETNDSSMTSKTPVAQSPSAQSTTSTTVAKYKRNMRFVQNKIQGTIIAAHDEIATIFSGLEPFIDNQPFVALQILCVAAFGTFIVVSWVPFKYLAACGVVAGFASGSIEVQALVNLLPTVVAMNMSEQVDAIREKVAAATKVPGGSVVVVQVWENQRWWAGLGFVPLMYPRERTPWTDESGTIPRTHKDKYTLPTDMTGTGTWAWIDTKWNLDYEWSPAGVDKKDGWQFSDNVWDNARGKGGIGFITRRRCWERRMRFVPNLGVSMMAGLISGSTTGSDVKEN